MAKNKKAVVKESQKPIEQYEHKDKQRLNNPPVGLVDAHTDNGGQKKKKYDYDPHLDPQLQWAGKTEHTSFEVPTVSLHVHERIDPRRIIESVRKKVEEEKYKQTSLFEEHKKPLREAIEFYKHKENWSNRLVAGDSLLVMNSLLEKEAMGGKVQMVYFDPPYGIKYGSNFQPFVNKRDVKDGKDEDLTSEPEMIKAFRDTWELGIHSYLTYLRDRFKLAKDLLHESGSVFVQISDENVHHVRELMDEVFGSENFVSLITFRKTGSKGSAFLDAVCDYIIFYSKSKKQLKYRQLFSKEKFNSLIHTSYSQVMDAKGKIRQLTEEEKNLEVQLAENLRPFQTVSITSQDPMENTKEPVIIDGVEYWCPSNRHWSVNPKQIPFAVKKGYVKPFGNSLRRLSFYDEEPGRLVTNIWDDLMGSDDPIYIVQTSTKAIQRCLLMTTDPGDLVLDITCGSGTTAFVAENWGRRWITCDTSRVALALAKQRLMTANFDYFELAYPDEGVGSGFKYKTVPHITLKSIANNEIAQDETLYDQPLLDNKRTRVTGPFTVEAVPAPVVRAMEDASTSLTMTDDSADSSVSRSGETLRQSEWKDRLKSGGIRGKGGVKIEFNRVETLSGTRYLQAEAETKEEVPKKVLICFGPEYAQLEQRTVELAMDEARSIKPRCDIILFCAFDFDPEARKDIEETNWPGITLLEAKMDDDLHIDDLKKKPRDKENPSFWLIGQPDVTMKELKSGDDKGKYIVDVNGFDYYNPKTGSVESGGKADIALWMLDNDYDGRSLFPSQVFFPMAGAKEGWATLTKNLKAEIDEEKFRHLNGTTSLPFTLGKAVAVKIIDARGIESLKIIRI